MKKRYFNELLCMGIITKEEYWEVCYKRWYHEEQEKKNYFNQNH